MVESRLPRRITTSVAGNRIWIAVEGLLLFVLLLESFLALLSEDVGECEHSNDENEHDGVDKKDVGLFSDLRQDALLGNSGVAVRIFDLAIGTREVGWTGANTVRADTSIETGAKALWDFPANRHKVSASVLDTLLSLPLKRHYA